MLRFLQNANYFWRAWSDTILHKLWRSSTKPFVELNVGSAVKSSLILHFRHFADTPHPNVPLRQGNRRTIKKHATLEESRPTKSILEHQQRILFQDPRGTLRPCWITKVSSQWLFFSSGRFSMTQYRSSGTFWTLPTPPPGRERCELNMIF